MTSYYFQDRPSKFGTVPKNSGQMVTLTPCRQCRYGTDNILVNVGNCRSLVFYTQAGFNAALKQHNLQVKRVTYNSDLLDDIRDEFFQSET